jgi:putative pyruvate formate lyase activating enzyme
MSFASEISLAQRATLAQARLKHCDLCSSNCGCDRLAGEKGDCGLDHRAWQFNECLHYGYEYELIPAHVIYLTGCNLRCTFCNVMDWIKHPRQGQPWNAELLAQRVAQRQEEGARTLIFVGGEPTVSLPAILELLSRIPNLPPIIWDTNLMFSPAARELLQGVVTTYIADYKFGDVDCARRMGGTAQYFSVLHENIHFAANSANLIIRHLMLPGHLECCFIPMLHWLKINLDHPRLSLRAGYMPPADDKIRDERLRQCVNNKEYENARSLAVAAQIELVD